MLSPLLANIALSVLDDHFVQAWQQTMGDHNARYRRRRKGLANWRLIRYADDWVVMVAGTRADTETLREQIAVLAPMGLRLSPTKTKVIHLREGFDSWATTSSGDSREEPTSVTSTRIHRGRR
jgi:RNA-directed DNA polymerase